MDDTLPKTTMNKAIKDRLPDNLRIGADALDLIISCCNELVHMISTQANEISEKEKKTTITPDHVIKALEELGYDSFLPAVNAAYADFKDERKEATEKANSRKAAKGTQMSAEELAELQAKLFAQARESTLTDVGPIDNAAAPPEQPQQQQQPDAAEQGS